MHTQTPSPHPNPNPNPLHHFSGYPDGIADTTIVFASSKLVPAVAEQVIDDMLCAWVWAGHQVTVALPAGNQQGSGARPRACVPAGLGRDPIMDGGTQPRSLVRRNTYRQGLGPQSLAPPQTSLAGSPAHSQTPQVGDSVGLEVALGGKAITNGTLVSGEDLMTEPTVKVGGLLLGR
jgi:hypothetical protein